MRRFLAVIAALLLAVVSVTPAQAAVAELELVSTRLVAKGAAVDVTFHVRCAGDAQEMHPADFQLKVQVSQRVGKCTVSGSAVTPVS